MELGGLIAGLAGMMFIMMYTHSLFIYVWFKCAVVVR